jgi:hypothetical protein
MCNLFSVSVITWRCRKFFVRLACFNNSVALVRKRSIPTERPPLVGKLVPTLTDRGCRVVCATDPYGPNLGFIDRSSLFSSKTVNSTVSNTGICFSSDNVGAVYIVQYILQNVTFNIRVNALCNLCEDKACCSSVQCIVKQLCLGHRSEQDTCAFTIYFLLEWPTLGPPGPFLLGHSLCRKIYL